jgi:hypothetical protein
VTVKSNEIKQGETYLFVATESPARKHLEGEPFTVVDIKAVFRRIHRKGTRKVKRFFNADGVGARADELEPLPERENPCRHCPTGTMGQVGYTQPNGTEIFQCDVCGHEERFP